MTGASALAATRLMRRCAMAAASDLPGPPVPSGEAAINHHQPSAINKHHRYRYKKVDIDIGTDIDIDIDIDVDDD